MAENKGIHDGHRDRVRDRFLKEGLRGFEDHQVMELLLFYGIPRKDTNEMGHVLMNRFGSLSAVFDASLESLMDCGLSRSCACMIKLVHSLCERYYTDKYLTDNKNTQINADNIGDCIRPFFIGKDVEHVLLMLLDAKGNRLFCDIISKGSFTSSEVNIKDILKLCIQFQAYSAILAHNHPSGIPLPSDQDVKLTLKLKNALASIGVRLIDHIIVSDMEFCPMSELEEFETFFY